MRGHSGTHFKLPFRPDDASAQLRSVATLDKRIDSKASEDLRQLARIGIRHCETLEMAACGRVGGRMD